MTEGLNLLRKWIRFRTRIDHRVLEFALLSSSVMPAILGTCVVSTDDISWGENVKKNENVGMME